MAESKGLVIPYAAKSSPDEKGSIDDQLREGHEWAEAQGFTVLAGYFEEDVSAYKRDRGEELANAMEHAEMSGATLVAQHSDRLARGDAKQARHLVEIALWALKAEVRIHCLQDPSTFQNLLMAVVMGDRNMEDSRRKAAAVKAGLARRRRKGLYTGVALYGYVYVRNADDERRLVTHGVHAEVVRRIYDEYLAGRSLLGIALGLNAEGILAVRGGPWSAHMVRAILMNPVYAGLLRDGEDLLEAQHEAIVPRETWEAAEALRRAKSRTHKRGRNPIGRHLFRKGFLRCGRCGKAVIPITHRNPNGQLSEIYRCSGRILDPTSCDVRSVSRAKVDEAVYAYFRDLDLDIEATRRQMASATERKLAEARQLHEEAQQAERESEARLKRVKHDYINGDLTAGEWRELRTELELDLAGARAETQKLTERLRETEEGTALLATQEEVLKALSEVREAIAKEVSDAEGAAALRAVLMRLFDGFVLHQGGSGSQEHLELVGGGSWIKPLVSEQAIDGYAEGLRPAFSHTPTDTSKNFASPMDRATSTAFGLGRALSTR